MAEETPQKRPKAIIDPDHPEAGRGGVVPPVETRFTGQPGPGRPKGSHSARAALMRKWRKDHESDTEAEEGEQRIGKEALRVADAIHAAALIGDVDLVTSLAKLIDQVEGKPQERVEMSEAKASAIVIHADDDGPPPALPGSDNP